MAGPFSFTSLNRSTFFQQNVAAQSIGPGLLSQFQVPVGQTYLNTQLFFYVGTPATPATLNQIIADVVLIKLKVNGIQISAGTGQQFAAIANFYKNNIVGNNGILPIFYERPWMQGVIAQRGPAWGMVGQNSFQIEVTLLTGGAITGIQMFHEIDPIASPLGRHVEVRTQSHTFGSTGQDNIIDLPQGDASALPDSIMAIHLELLGGSGIADKTDVSNLVVRADKVELWNTNVNTLENSYLFPTSPRTPQAKYLSLDFAHRNRQDGELWDNMNTLVVIPTFTVQPGTYNIVMEVMTGTPGATAGK